MSATAELRNELDSVKIKDSTLSELANAWKKYTKTPPSFRKTPPPFVLNEDLYPIEQENQLIDYFYTYYTDNPKKIVQMVRRIYNDVPRFMQRSLLDNILESSDPRKLLLMYFSEKVKWGEIIERLIAEGNHGVIYNDQEVWGFQVATMAKWLKENDKWTIEDEKEIIKKSYYKHCRENNITHFKGKVMMFHHFGFSGMSYFFDHPIDDTEGY